MRDGLAALATRPDQPVLLGGMKVQDLYSFRVRLVGCFEGVEFLAEILAVVDCLSRRYQGENE